MSSLPAPLIEAHIDLTKLPYMPLEVRRLLESDTWIEAANHPYLGHVLISLWCASWRQVPAGSLPWNAHLLARMSFRSLAELEPLMPEILKSWIPCSDGRLYHPVVCEKAMEAWEKLTKDMRRVAAASLANKARFRKNRDDHRNGKRDEERNDDPDNSVADDVPPLADPTPPKDDPPPPAPAKKPPAKSKARLDRDGNSPNFTPGFLMFWNAYPRKDAKQEAWKVWQRDMVELGLEEFAPVLVRDITNRIENDRKWFEGFIPHATTYLNQRRWTDDVEPRRQVNTDQQEKERKAAEDRKFNQAMVAYRTEENRLQDAVLTLEANAKAGIQVGTSLIEAREKLRAHRLTMPKREEFFQTS